MRGNPWPKRYKRNQLTPIKTGSLRAVRMSVLGRFGCSSRTEGGHKARPELSLKQHSKGLNKGHMTEANSADGSRARGGRGEFFIVHQGLWKAICDVGDINAAAAWLLLAQGTGGNHRTTAWSVDSIMRYLGMGYPRGKAAIEKLIALNFIRHGEKHTPRKPRYDLLSFTEWAVMNWDAVPRGTGDEDSGSPLIWLPNALITGASHEKSPIHKLRAAGDLWALRLFVDLYQEQNLRDDGGIPRTFLWEKYEAIKLGERGAYSVMGFKHGGEWVNFSGPFLLHQSRPKPTKNSQPVFDSLRVLKQTGLLTFVPHLVENDTKDAEVIHAFGIGGHSEHEIETEIGTHARKAALAMCAPWHLETAESAGLLLCPVSRDYPKAQMVGIARLHYRPHTKRTSAWARNLQQCGAGYVTQFRRLAEECKVKDTAFA